VGELFASYQTSLDDEEEQATKEEFQTCLARLQSQDLLRLMSFAECVLLRPELLDAYASAIVQAARDEPDGLGSLSEEVIKAGRFRMPADERVSQIGQEQLLLLATIEELLRHEIAFREFGEDSIYLVFPSQFTRDWPQATSRRIPSCRFDFEGPVASIYATLTVRLTRSGTFTKENLWRNAASFRSPARALCEMRVVEAAEGPNSIEIYFDSKSSRETKLSFTGFVQAHLRRRSVPGSVRFVEAVTCGRCGEPVAEHIVATRRGRGVDYVMCSMCDERIELHESLATESAVPNVVGSVQSMDENADAGRAREVSASILEARRETGDYDVFLCHNSVDKDSVKKVAESLVSIGVLPWFDAWDLKPGKRWRKELEAQLSTGRCVAVFFGAADQGAWQELEIDAILREAIERDCSLIPVFLPSCTIGPAELPPLLAGFTAVDMRVTNPDPIKRLVWGVLGR
jgi:hypothetical protein